MNATDGQERTTKIDFRTQAMVWALFLYWALLLFRRDALVATVHWFEAFIATFVRWLHLIGWSHG